ncbi:M43 family zinc metalloprotease [Acinetobacter haemolyticus]|uniref:M43 family zinc metalloprotease n=1 Tax=Acinetobacter haemolyticus TaxID=29430 RepID=UPI003AF764F4
MVYIGYENGILRLRFDDFRSNDIKSIEYVSGKLNISNYAGYFYSLNFTDLATAKLVFADDVYKNIKIIGNDILSVPLVNKDDWVVGTNGSDIFLTNNVGERVFGGAGDDTYVVKPGNNIIVTDYSGSNTLDLSNYKVEDITIKGSKSGLELKYTENDKVTIEGVIQNYKFSDNIILSQDQFLIGREVVIQGTSDSEILTGYVSDDVIYAGDGDDTLNGNQGDDTLIGGRGNDILNGGQGNDKYIFSKGDGVDYINDFSGSNEIIFQDVKSSDVYYTFDGGTLNIHYTDKDIIKIQNFLANNRDNFSIKFSDGKLVTHENFDAEVGIQYWVRNLISSTNTSADFKYAFPDVAPNYITNSKELNGWAQLGLSGQNYVLSRFDQLSAATGLTFDETDNLAQKNVIAVQKNIQASSSGYAYYPSNSYIGSDIFFNVDYSSEPLKSWQQYVYPHEIGHALGLRHSFEGPKKELFSSAEESTRWTVMSYNTVDYSDGNFKAFDYAALQAMYGVNQNIRSGDDVYRFDGTIGVLVWDGGGKDTIDASGSNLNAYIDLRSGAWSYLGEKSAYISSANQLAINLSTIIENAVGTDFNDILIGNHHNNILVGGLGNDILDGGLGADVMIGGVGDDIYYVDNILDNVVEKEGEGYDIIYSTVSYNLKGRHVEELHLVGDAHINATGNTKDNILIGNAGNNILDGGAGNDILDGGLGADVMIGGVGDDIYYVDNILDDVVEKEGEGYDIIYSTVSYNLKGRHVEELHLVGDAHINATGNTKDNILIGNSGDNIFVGGQGSDTVVFKLLSMADSAGGNGMDTWLDFKVGNTLTDPNADKVNISELLVDFDGEKTVDSLISFISFTKQGSDSVMNIDRDGSGQDFNSTALLTFKNIDVNLADLLNNHQLIV